MKRCLLAEPQTHIYHMWAAKGRLLTSILEPNISSDLMVHQHISKVKKPCDNAGHREWKRRKNRRRRIAITTITKRRTREERRYHEIAWEGQVSSILVDVVLSLQCH